MLIKFDLIYQDTTVISLVVALQRFVKETALSKKTYLIVSQGIIGDPMWNTFVVT